MTCLCGHPATDNGQCSDCNRIRGARKLGIKTYKKVGVAKPRRDKKRVALLQSVANGKRLEIGTLAHLCEKGLVRLAKKPVVVLTKKGRKYLA